ncbi:MAG TPA: hypothetical protein VND97_03690, partial [Beijerinckiaceae bacterium]|nr:hypothetical protein [Beijerinckiaceae bacterium]
GDCRGWLHEAAGARGVLICSAWGFEELCSRRSMASLANLIAAMGLPVLRFDFRATGDSGDEIGPDGLLETWRADLRHAAAFLRAACGVSELTIIGLRTGASLATQIAAELETDRLALLAPVVSGKAFARELRALAQIARNGAAPGASAARGSSEGSDAAGFELPREALAELRDLDLTRLPRRPCPSVLILTPNAPPLDAFASCLKDLDARVEIHEFRGYDQMMCDPTASETPVAALQLVADWSVRDAPPARVAAALPATADVIDGGGWIEEPARFGHSLTGVYARPKGPAPRRAALFLNAGAVHHIGWARMHVAMARRLARLGVASLRMDGAGIGDSAADEEHKSLFASQRRADVAAAIDWLAAKGVRELTLVGACSGAHHAFHLACEDRRIQSVVLVNMVCILWGPSYAMQLRAWQATKTAEMQARGFGADFEEGRNRIAALASLALPLAKKFAKSSFGALKTLSALAASGFGRVNSVEQKFRELAARGVQVNLVYSEYDAGLDELARYMGQDGARALLYPNVKRILIPDADHTLTQPHAREALAGVVEQAMGADMQAAPRQERSAPADMLERSASRAS